MAFKPIRYGDKGLRVRALQKRLNRDESKPPKVTVDGKYGDETLRAVKHVERWHGLRPDGIVGITLARKLSLRRAIRRLRRRRADRRIGVVQREEWGALPPRGAIGGVLEPTKQHFLHCTVSGAISPDAPMSEEIERMQNLQKVGFSRGFYDISYSFVVFPSGRIYEGRGWDKAGAHTEGFNSTTYAVAAYIPCAGEPVTEKLIASMAKPGKQGVRNGSVDKFVWVRGHREVAPKSCPGQPVYNRKDDIQASIRSA